MESLILFILSVILATKGKGVANFLTDRNVNAYRKIFGTKVLRFEPFIRVTNIWGIRFSAAVLFLMSIAILFGPIEF